MPQTFTGTFAVAWAPMVLNPRLEANNYLLNWYGTSGVRYQPMYSTNLVDWLPYEGTVPGADGPLQVVVPTGTAPRMFFRVVAVY